ncbi:NAD-dependent epimerase/dehydratase family protein [Burkholderia pseudomallei]|uniref:NAD-dependent epimerase/dehydratase family protein n=1 Tax=Burkholderia pseudomallei TaxID=28450 RepID=UPI0003D8FBCF|nr:sugar nucleotide-binding protein [Burkholderia pseudomallei]AHE32426.1 rmlD substrate binding domain protein [Burkholderia pseudomallei NAU20B-16]AHG34094.1 rmlD substrate binding domain protein [Burkholderia pseudomallei MSHR511]AHG67710.1 rmlD substrate binding domain protein [Burkholderia pseudomallei MSHR146]KGV08002.1 rmlD substrate binding domain protein [Burkholderia pseudomallei MSHR4503]KGW24673.1 rmlD substrate binding domain protein [Burkholderia pseudomallei MSHR3016]
MKVFLVGSTGYIGKTLFDACSQRWRTLGTSTRDGADIVFSLARAEAFPYEQVSAGDVVAVAAAISSPDACAKDYETAFQVNVTGTLTLIRGVVARGARVIFFSSDTVYGASEQLLSEEAELTPAGAYGAMKRQVEAELGENAAVKVIRLSYVFSLRDRFTQYLLGCAKEGKRADIFKPFSRCVVYLSDVVEGVVSLIERWDAIDERVINFVGPELVAREDFVEKIRNLAAPELDYGFSEPEGDFFVNRPRIINVSSARFEKLLGRRPRSLGEAINLELSN